MLKGDLLVTEWRALFIIGCIVGFVFVALGACSIYYFLAVKQVMEHASNDFYGNYGIDGIILIVMGLAFLSQFYPILIPLKKNNLNPVKTCQFCGAMVEESATICIKCNQLVENAETTDEESAAENQ
jgi:hypothetical protein